MSRSQANFAIAALWAIASNVSGVAGYPVGPYMYGVLSGIFMAAGLVPILQAWLEPAVTS